ncbi:PHP domain-containing protein [Bacteroidota bacterium]
MFEYAGAIHIHTIYSDGSGEVEEIAKNAEEVGLDFILITDHNTLRAQQEGCEKWYGKTLALVGCEINDKENKNHYLAFNTTQTFSTRRPAKEYVDLVDKDGGIGFIAHPHEKRSSMAEHPPYPWLEWDIPNFTGIEIWNHMSEWMEGLTDQNKYNYFVHPLSSIISPQKETLKVWDELNMKRRVVGIGGIDAHAHKLNLLGFFEVEVFPYKVMLKSIRTHILTDEKIEPGDSAHNLDTAKKNIYDALKKGRCFISNFYHGDAAGFKFFAKTDKKTYGMGDSPRLTKNMKLCVVLPGITAEIRLVHNGELIETITDKEAEFKIAEKGAYRVEVFIENNAWIFSNHIRIGL